MAAIRIHGEARVGRRSPREFAANLGLVIVFTRHMMGAIAGAGPHIELSIEGSDYYPWQDGLFEPVLTVHDGKVRFPDGPGWGVEIDRGRLERAELAVSEARG